MKFDDDLFADELRRRLRILLEMKGLSINKFERRTGNSSLKDFLNGRAKSPKLLTFLGWSRALDIPQSVLIDGIGYVFDDFDPYAESHIVDETKAEEIELRQNSAKNLRFLRGMLGESAETFAKASGCMNKGAPDIKLYLQFESGEKMIPPMIAMRLAGEFPFTVEDIYSLYGHKIAS